jgi:glycine/D-amino acid oxidase-like deaminating enzyme
MKNNLCDVIIVGGGVMGSSTAYYLMSYDHSLEVTVIEPDPTYAQASTTLSVGNTRIQFSLKENILISQYTFNVLEQFEDSMAVDDKRPNIAYRREGNLFLVDDAGRGLAKQALGLQKSLGCQVEWWSAQKIKKRYPLFEPKGLAGGSFGPLDGHVDPYAVLMGYRAKARSLGAKYIKNQVVEIITDGTRATLGLPA